MSVIFYSQFLRPYLQAQGSLRPAYWLLGRMSCPLSLYYLLSLDFLLPILFLPSLKIWALAWGVGCRRGRDSFSLSFIKTFRFSPSTYLFHLLVLSIHENILHPTATKYLGASSHPGFRISENMFPCLCSLEEKVHQNRDVDSLLGYAIYLLCEFEKLLNNFDPQVPPL